MRTDALREFVGLLNKRNTYDVIAAVHLFNAESLVSELRRRGVGLRNPVSVRSELWSRAEIHPRPSTEYVLSAEQRIWLKRFG